VLMTSALWSHATPPQAVLDAYEQDPELRAMRLEFAATLEDYFITLAIGLNARR
jgi:Tetracyclin repressor-like, C-terminal domain